MRERDRGASAPLRACEREPGHYGAPNPVGVFFRSLAQILSLNTPESGVNGTFVLHRVEPQSISISVKMGWS